MSQSAIWDALLIAGDALQDGRMGDWDAVCAQVEEMGAWEFESYPVPYRRLTPERFQLIATSIGGQVMRVVTDPDCPRDAMYLVNGECVISPIRFDEIASGRA